MRAMLRVSALRQSRAAFMHGLKDRSHPSLHSVVAQQKVFLCRLRWRRQFATQDVPRIASTTPFNGLGPAVRSAAVPCLCAVFYNTHRCMTGPRTSDCPRNNLNGNGIGNGCDRNSHARGTGTVRRAEITSPSCNTGHRSLGQALAPRGLTRPFAMERHCGRGQSPYK